MKQHQGWVNKNLCIRENFVGFYYSPTTTGNALFELTKKCVEGVLKSKKNLLQ